MADPLSIATGAVALIQASGQLVSFLRKVYNDFDDIDEELKHLLDISESTLQTTQVIKDAFERAETLTFTRVEDHLLLAKHAELTKKRIADSTQAINALYDIVVKVTGKTSQRGRLGQIRKYLAKQAKQDELDNLKGRSADNMQILSISLHSVNLLVATHSSASTSKQITNLEGALKSGLGEMGARVDTLLDPQVHPAVVSSEALLSRGSNQHFYLPRGGISSLYTGRTNELQMLHDLFFKNGTISAVKQKRFVVYGPPGAGKTEFCSNFASLNKRRFWGVFHIIATSNESVKQGFINIARYGKVEPTDTAGKNWLSQMEADHSWLLIIDNADEDKVDIEQCYPDGDNGMILITTRDPGLEAQGTMSRRSFGFDGLDEEPSIDLLLRGANLECPGSGANRAAARKISRRLGHLPLALKHAGRAMRLYKIPIDQYLESLQKKLDRMRNTRSITNQDADLAIFTTYDLLHDNLHAKRTQASEDALQLLKMSSFLDPHSISLEIFTKAVTGPYQEEQYAVEKSRNSKLQPRSARARPTFLQLCRYVILFMSILLLRLFRGRSLLPRMIAKPEAAGHLDAARFMSALTELHRSSLIKYDNDESPKSYSIHPAVHWWTQNRPQMSRKEQLAWCNAAATLLKKSILLPPVGDSEEHELFRRDVLSHIRHVQKAESSLQKSSLPHLRTRSSLGYLESRTRVTNQLSKFDVREVDKCARFSIVYMQCGEMEDAEELQKEVLTFAECWLGSEDDRTLNAKRLLATTLWLSGQPERSLELQRQVFEELRTTRGEDDVETLRAMREYGFTLWLRGRYYDAQSTLERCVSFYKNKLTVQHEDTLRAMDKLGQVLTKNHQFTKAIAYHSIAASGLSRKLGESHLDTLTAMEDLAMSHFDRVAYGYGKKRRDQLDRAMVLERRVLDGRSKKLGKGHFLTLFSNLNLGRIKGLNGIRKSSPDQIQEALKMLEDGHAIAIQHMKETDFRMLFGRGHYGRVLMYDNQFAKAEQILSRVLELHEYRAREYPDTRQNPDVLLPMFSLIKCRRVLNPAIDDGALVQKFMNMTKSMLGSDHPAVKYLSDPRNLMVAPGDTAEAFYGTDTDRLEPSDLQQLATAGIAASSEPPPVLGAQSI